MKLAPMNKLEEIANTKPLILSEDIPLYASLQLPLEPDMLLYNTQKKSKSEKPSFGYWVCGKSSNPLGKTRGWGRKGGSFSDLGFVHWREDLGDELGIGEEETR